MSQAEDLEAELYWSFRSPYSYLALPRVKRWDGTVTGCMKQKGLRPRG